MRLAVWPVLISVGVVAFLVAGCGGNGGGPDVTVSPSPAITPAGTSSPEAAATPTATPTPTAVPTATAEVVAAPDAAPIEVDPGVNSLGEGSILPTLAPDGVLNLDPIDLAEGLGIAPPPCAALVLYLTWQVREPYPAEGVDLEFYWTRMGGTELFAEGPSGQASRGCGAIQVVNNSAVQVTVEIRYAIGEVIG